MATYVELPQAISAQGHRLPGASQSPVLRLSLPLLYAAIGLSIGTMLGITAGVITTPASASTSLSPATSNDSIQASSTGAQFASSPGVNSELKANVQPAAVVYMTAVVSKPATDPGLSTANQAPSGALPAKPLVNMEHSPTVQTPPDKRPTVETSPTHRIAPAEERPAKPVAHPLVRPRRTALASDLEVTPVPMDNEQLSLVDDVKPMMTYIEGDFTVADYDAQAGTIDTSDGRTFALGQTVSVSGATSWDDSRSDVHYRCGQDGSCTLSRLGAIALNAKLV